VRGAEASARGLSDSALTRSSGCARCSRRWRRRPAPSVRRYGWGSSRRPAPGATRSAGPRCCHTVRCRVRAGIPTGP